MKISSHYVNLIQNRGNALYNLNMFLRQDNGNGFAKAVRLLEKNNELKFKVYAISLT